jgi:hypothetical protein
VVIPDTTRPVVVSTVPANGATNVPLNQVLTATFSKPMNPATISATTFTVAGPGGASVTGTVTYTSTGSIATFTPAAALASGTLYTATITTGAQDTATPANSLATNYVWTFTTVVIPPVVVSTIPAAGATGVPLNQVISATFSKAMNAATINATTFTVKGPGAVAVAGVVTYAGTVATFTPAVPLIAITLYTATITTGAQDVAGDPLAANFTWTFTTTAVAPRIIVTVPVDKSVGVPVNQVLSVTFTKAMNAATINTTTFTLQNSLGVAIGGTVAYAGTTATFTPAANLAPNTVYTATITTGAQDVAGDALAANFVWTFRTALAPAVISTNPANNATGVPINRAVTATFNEPVDPTTVSATTFTIAGPEGPVTGVVTYIVAGSIATFTPTAPLIPGLYTATITTGVMNPGGTPLAANYVWTFTTGIAPDTTPPTVIATTPVNNAVAVPTNETVIATFSEAMTPATINAATFTLTGPGATAVAGTVTYAGIGNTATFKPTANLAAGTLFTATITTGAKDLAGNALVANFVWTFTTGAGPDITSPTIVVTSPANGAVGVPLNGTISATFSEAMDPLTVTTATFTLSAPTGPPVAATVAYDPVNFIATLTPSALLTANTTYTANVTTGVTDLAGNPLVPGVAPNPWVFTTGATVSLPPPPLGTAALFGTFGGLGMTNQGVFTVVNGNIGTTGVSTTITGFHDNSPGCVYTETPLNVGLVNGTINTAPPPPTVFCPTEGTAVTGAIAAQAAADTLIAYNALVAFPNGMDVSTCPGCGGGGAGELGNRTLAPGVYKSASGSYNISLGDLTLDAKGDPNAVWVFQMATTLDVGTPQFHRSVLLVNGAQAKNVFWQVGSAATINGILGGGTMSGTVIAQDAISVSTAGVVAITTINGRTLVMTGPVTVVNTVINVPAP